MTKHDIEFGGFRNMKEEAYRPLREGEKIRIVFIFQVPSQWPAWESLYYALLNDSRFDINILMLKDKVDKSRQQDTAEEFLNRQSLAYKIYTDSIFSMLAPHIVLLQTPYEYALREFHLYARRLKNEKIRIAYIPYGIEIVDTRSARHDHFRRPFIKQAWRIYTASEAFKKEYEKYCENASAVRGLGLPRFDMLKQKDRFRLSQVIIDAAKGRKIIVWHVHFVKKIDVDGQKKQVTPYVEEYLNFAKQLSDWSELAFFIFLPHPRFADDAVDEESNRKSKEIISLLQKLENVYIDTEDDYRPSLLNADAIISDRSSLAVEAAVVNVPVLFMENKDYVEPVFPPLRPIFYSYEHGYGSVDMYRFVQSFLSGKIIANKSVLPNFDGKCAERIVEDMAFSLKQNTEMKKTHIRLILFGTGYIYESMKCNMKKTSGAEIIALSDNNKDKWGELIDGVKVIPPVEINEMCFDKIVVCTENVFEDEIRKQLVYDLEIPANKVESCDYLSVL